MSKQEQETAEDNFSKAYFAYNAKSDLNPQFLKLKSDLYYDNIVSAVIDGYKKKVEISPIGRCIASFVIAGVATTVLGLVLLPGLGLLPILCGASAVATASSVLVFCCIKLLGNTQQLNLPKSQERKKELGYD